MQIYSLLGELSGRTCKSQHVLYFFCHVTRLFKDKLFKDEGHIV